MRSYVFLTILTFGVFWAYDEYKYGGGNTQTAWRWAGESGRNISSEVQRTINGALSGH
jgi:hypothetical protein